MPGAKDGASSPRDRKRRRVLVPVAVAVTVAATVAGVALYAISDPGGNTTTNSADASPTPSHSPSPVPDGFHLVTEKSLGVAFPIPDGWKAGERTSEQVVYTDETGLVGITIGVVNPAGSHPMAHFKDIEANTKLNYPTSYRRLRMQKTTFRGQPAAVWEFTFQGRARAWRAIDLGFGREGEREYDIYLSAPEADWGTHRPVFDKVRDGFITNTP